MLAEFDTIQKQTALLTLLWRPLVPVQVYYERERIRTQIAYWRGRKQVGRKRVCFFTAVVIDGIRLVHIFFRIVLFGRMLLLVKVE